MLFSVFRHPDKSEIARDNIDKALDNVVNTGSEFKFGQLFSRHFNALFLIRLHAHQVVFREVRWSLRRRSWCCHRIHSNLIIVHGLMLMGLIVVAGVLGVCSSIDPSILRVGIFYFIVFHFTTVVVYFICLFLYSWCNAFNFSCSNCLELLPSLTQNLFCLLKHCLVSNIDTKLIVACFTKFD